MLARTLLAAGGRPPAGGWRGWRYDRRRRVLHAVISARRGGLVAHAC